VSLFSDYTLRTILLGTMSLGLFCAVLGSFAVLRRQSLVGDTLAHAALPGVCIGFLLTGSKAPLPILIGAALTAGLAMAWVRWITTKTRTDWNTALGIALTSLFGLGVLLLSLIQRSPSANQAGLDTILFGQAAALVQENVIAILIVGIVATAILVRIRQPYQLLAFDPDFARASGLNTARIEFLQTTLLVAGIIIGLNTVGVVLLSALLVAPTIAARPWVRSTSQLLIISAIFGLVSSATGALISVNTPNLPTGPTVVIISTLAVVVSQILYSLSHRKQRTPEVKTA
jgi:manganese/zinc/iron transport system permease protein